MYYVCEAKKIVHLIKSSNSFSSAAFSSSFFLS